MEESKNIINLKARLIKELPFFPNDRSTLESLQAEDLNGVIIHYLHWKTRLVPVRKRRVNLSPEVTSDKRWKALRIEIKKLFDKARNGESLNPYLSERAHKKGYTPAQRIRDGLADSWEDKDQILNTTGFHHFHLNMNVLASGLSERTNEVLFAHVTRDCFHAIGIFDHSVFESANESGSITDERARIWELHKKYVTVGLKPGDAYFNNIISTSGHPLYVVRMGDYYADIIRNNDSKLNDRSFVNNLYEQGKITPPSKYNFDWHLEDLDIGILDRKTRVYFCIHQGHI